jgi:GntR family transcriptional regulator/MocR family aminotransferase
MKRANQSAHFFAAAVWQLDADGPPLRTQLYRQLRDAVTEGRVASGASVPSTRELAAVLGVSRSTLVEALDQLRVEGYLETRQGAATRIAALNPAHLSQRRSGARGPGHPAPGVSGDDVPPVRLGHWVQDDPPTPVTVRAFRPGLPDIRAFPAREWATNLARRARQPASHDLSYVGHTGVPSLREQIVRHVGESRHVVARPEQVIVLPSAQAAFDVAIRCSLRSGDPAWVEDPCYPGIRTLLRAHGAKVIPVPVDADGMRPAGQRSRPRLIYLTPSHQYPTGAMLSLPRRLELLDIARRHGAAIIEDDYDSEFQIDGQPIASLQGLDRSGCVHYVGTFSKSLAPGVRVAYLIVPLRCVELAETIASASGLGVSVHVQLAMADFMADGALRRHIHRMRAEYGERLSLLHRTLVDSGFERVFPGPPSGGLQLCVALRPGTSDTQVAKGLSRQGLHAVPLSTLCHDREWMARPGLLLGIGLVPRDEVEGRARALCAAMGATR